jgi:mRNA-degrading endonuclease RelE of RelBE toxin-antitoxin system
VTPSPTAGRIGSRNRLTPQFVKMLFDLPPDIQKLARQRFRQFLKTPFDPSFDTKPLHDKKKTPHKDGTWSVRVDRRYRALFVIENDTNLWYWIGSHNAYNTFVGCKKK